MLYAPGPAVNELRDSARRWQAASCRAVRVSIIEARGSTPQAVGACMLVCADQIAGTIGGGNLEWQAVTRARALLNESSPGSVEERQSLGASLGQCCGGAVRLRFELVSESMIAIWPVEKPLFELHLFGMGHVAEALVNVLSALSCVIHWHDEREGFVALRSRQWLSRNIKATLLIAGDGDRGHQQGGAPTLALIMTHSHAVDFDLCRIILAGNAYEWVGLIGSRTKRARFERRLRQAGLIEPQIQKLTCPIGLTELKFKQPELLALSVAAQLLQVVQIEAPQHVARSCPSGDTGKVADPHCAIPTHAASVPGPRLVT
jgi:xanthine dehydrogenase accessory factor